jgi:hypothetical protein
MAPKEKAKQLVDSFEDDLMESDVCFLEFAKKRCALKSIEFAKEFITGDLTEAFDKTMYLFEIKTEIEKL